MTFLEACSTGLGVIVAIMTALLLRVSGVTLLERTLTTNKPGDKEYVERTSAFTLWFPRKKA
jgi:steroid 5-alpha reductase family enzyme